MAHITNPPCRHIVPPSSTTATYQSTHHNIHFLTLLSQNQYNLMQVYWKTKLPWQMWQTSYFTWFVSHPQYHSQLTKNIATPWQPPQESDNKWHKTHSLLPCHTITNYTLHGFLSISSHISTHHCNTNVMYLPPVMTVTLIKQSPILSQHFLSFIIDMNTILLMWSSQLMQCLIETNALLPWQSVSFITTALQMIPFKDYTLLAHLSTPNQPTQPFPSTVKFLSQLNYQFSLPSGDYNPDS